MPTWLHGCMGCLTQDPPSERQAEPRSQGEARIHLASFAHQTKEDKLVCYLLIVRGGFLSDGTLRARHQIMARFFEPRSASVGEKPTCTDYGITPRDSQRTNKTKKALVLCQWRQLERASRAEKGISQSAEDSSSHDNNSARTSLSSGGTPLGWGGPDCKAREARQCDVSQWMILGRKKKAIARPLRRSQPQSMVEGCGTTWHSGEKAHSCSCGVHVQYASWISSRPAAPGRFLQDTAQQSSDYLTDLSYATAPVTEGIHGG